MKTWKRKVQSNYESLRELEAYDEQYGIVKRCGYDSAEELWNANPWIGGSTNPNDFGIVSRCEMMDDAQRAALAREVFGAVNSSTESMDAMGMDLAYLMGAILETDQSRAFVEWASDIMPELPPIHGLLRSCFAEDHLVWEFINTKTNAQLEEEESRDKA